MSKEKVYDGEFSLLIRRYSTYSRYDTIEELKEAVNEHFTEREKAAGVPDKLTSFPRSSFVWDAEDCGHYEAKWQDFTTCYYPRNGKPDQF